MKKSITQTKTPIIDYLKTKIARGEKLSDGEQKFLSWYVNNVLPRKTV